MGIVGGGGGGGGRSRRRLVGVDMGNGIVGELESWRVGELELEMAVVCKLRPRLRMGMRVELEGY